jgi:hypothetical protein
MSIPDGTQLHAYLLFSGRSSTTEGTYCKVASEPADNTSLDSSGVNLFIRLDNRLHGLGIKTSHSQTQTFF